MPSFALLRRARTCTYGATEAPARSDLHALCEPKETELKISSLELFFDLFYVVMIHVICIPLQDEEEVVPWVWLRVAFMMSAIWFSWVSVSDYILETWYYGGMQTGDIALVFITMICAGFMARASCHEDQPAFVFWYLTTLFIVVCGNAFTICRLPQVPMNQEAMSKTRWNSAMNTVTGVVIFCYDAALLVPACYLTKSYGNQFDIGLAFWGSHFLIKALLLCWVGFYMFRDLNELYQPVLQLWMERFDVLILISLGEVVASSLASSSADDMLQINLVGLGAMLMAIACYLLYFAAHPTGWRRPVSQGVGGLVVEGYVTWGSVSALATMGAAYTRLAEDNGSNKEEHRLCQSFALLVLATCVFLSVSSVISILGEPLANQQTRLSGKVRGWTRSTFGIAIGLLLFLRLDLDSLGPSAIALVVPCMLFILAFFELWASSTVSSDDGQKVLQDGHRV